MALAALTALAKKGLAGFVAKGSSGGFTVRLAKEFAAQGNTKTANALLEKAVKRGAPKALAFVAQQTGAPITRIAPPSTPQPSTPMLTSITKYTGAQPVLTQSFAGGAIGSAIGGAIAGIGATIGGRITDKIFGQGGTAAPPPVPSSFQIPEPLQGPVGRTISRILPGGKTGREFTAATDLTDRVGRPIAVHPMVRESVVGPSGYVMVNMNGERIAMLKSFAIRAGLYKSPPKPPVSGYDMRAITRAAAAGKRVKKLASKVGFSCVTKGRSRAAAPRKTRCK